MAVLLGQVRSAEVARDDEILKIQGIKEYD
jgi:hypothetical protein